MHQALLFLLLFSCGLVLGQAPNPRYTLTIAGYQPGDTMAKDVFHNSPYIAEAVDDFGFDVVLRHKYIQRYSINLYLKDSLVVTQKRVTGCKFSKDVLKFVENSHSLCKVEIIDLVLKREGEQERLVKGPTVFFLK